MKINIFTPALIILGLAQFAQAESNSSQSNHTKKEKKKQDSKDDHKHSIDHKLGSGEKGKNSK